MRLSLTLSVLLCVIAAHALAAQATEACVAVDLRDTTNLVKKEIDAQYAKLAHAMRRRDLDALFALYTSDFHAITPRGEVWTRARSLAYQRNGMAQVKETHHISNTIVGLTVCGMRAKATVLQVWERTQMMVGKLRYVHTHATQDEEWVKEEGTWKRGNIDYVRNGPAFVDGKRVDTNVPYDPDAPEYDPYEARPKRPAE